MTETDRKIAEELKKKLADAVPLLDLRIFGSRARGEQKKYSDYDMLIVVDKRDREIVKKSGKSPWRFWMSMSV